MEELKELLASCEFARPFYFWIGGGLVLLAIFFPLFRRRRGLGLDLEYWRARVRFGSRRVWIVSCLVVISSILMAVALTDPEIAESQSRLIHGKPVLLVVDVSGSMGIDPAKYAPEGTPLADPRTNFEKARDVFLDLVDRWPDVDFALLMYSTENYVARYFAYKNELLKDTMENQSEIDFISTGTRPVEALDRARTFLTDNFEGKDKAIVLISDLDVDFVTLLGISEQMEKDSLAGITDYIIVVEEGESAGAYWNPRQSEVKEALKIVSMYDTEGIDRVCEELFEMRSSPLVEEEVLSTKSLIPFLVSPILGLVGVCLVLSETRFRRLP